MTAKSATANDRLSTFLDELAELVGRAGFALSGPRREELIRLRDRLRHDLGNHAARARDLDAPLLVVLGGVTGAGKSTVTNTLAGRPVVATGVIRPTTTHPTLLCNPADRSWFTGPRILEALTRQLVAPEDLAGAPDVPGVLRIVPVDDVRPGLALLDAPDIDSVATANRDLADLLLDAADLWLWFTTVGKYADAESMAYLARAARRGTALVVVLTQVRDPDRDPVLDDFSGKLAGAGIRPDAVVTVPWVDGMRRGGDTAAGGALPPQAIGELSSWMDRLADPDERRQRRRRTLAGAMAALDGELAPLTAAVEHELEVARDLVGVIDERYDEAVARFAATVDDGLPLRGEVLGRWTDYVGSSRMLELTGRVTTQARRWVGDLLRGSSGAGDRRIEREMRVEIADTVTATMTQLADLAAHETVERWNGLPEGRALAGKPPGAGDGAGPGGAGRPSGGAGRPDGHERGFADRCRDAVRDWQDAVVQLVAEKGVQRRTRARWMSTAVNAVATGAIVVTLASTGGLTGAEAGIATAAGAANQALLVALLGERTVRWLVTESRRDLVRRFEDLLVPERRRLVQAVAAAAPDPGLPAELRRTVNEARPLLAPTGRPR